MLFRSGSKPPAGKIIPGGCAAAKPAPQTRTTSNTPSQGLGGCKLPAGLKDLNKEAKDRKFRPDSVLEPTQNSGARHGEYHQVKIRTATQKPKNSKSRNFKENERNGNRSISKRVAGQNKSQHREVQQFERRLNKYTRHPGERTV